LRREDAFAADTIRHALSANVPPNRQGARQHRHSEGTASNLITLSKDRPYGACMVVRWKASIFLNRELLRSRHSDNGKITAVIDLELATVLLLHKSSLLIGAVCFLYVRWQSGKRLGLRFMATSFILLAVASTIAGAGERGELPYYAWTLLSFTLGPTAYGLLWIGIRRLVRERVSPRDWIAFSVAPVLFTIAVITDFHLINVYRATVFLTVMTLFMTSCAFIVMRGNENEAISARFPLAISFAAKAILGLISIASIIAPGLVAISVSETFFLLILCHFLIAMFVQVFAKERAEIRLIHLLETDPLTQIHNRHWFFSHLPTVPAPGDSFIIIDIDHFKQVNDNFGHAVGDQVLVATAETMAESLSVGTILARVGGEEFGLYVKSTSLDGTIQQAERLRSAVEALALQHEGKHIPVTISLGVATATERVEMQTLMCNADRALYAAKANGRNRIEEFAPASHGLRPMRTVLETLD
jgi:diguanylate cyclase (GGDEF)-like protein